MCGNISTRECLTYDRLPGVLPNTHKPHLYCLYPGQLSAGTWPKRKTHLSRSFKDTHTTCWKGPSSLA
ncbi:hypothetical protein CgunFtcFv8_023409 [Champsocephalus gunnari]|uniref:Uncharacterized protein n=1 Tax=Champsocephalus gunnari TaxID=52237 RepID=A0AAN8HKV7_CHAGU|nr:hypothetical protein CgunFtcFv8_023409 [Champsocephalus gunnari]